jgi:N-acetylmuramoyl-L-alanine amidase
MMKGKRVREIMASSRRFAAMALVALSFLCAVATSQPSATIRFEKGSSGTAQVRGIRQNALLFVSMNDVAQALALRFKEDFRDTSLAIQQGSYIATFFAHNPFVSIAELGKEKSARQLISGVVYSKGSFFAPLVSVVKHSDQFLGTATSYDTANNTLRIIKPKPTFDISTLTFEQKSNGTLIHIPSDKVFADYEALLKEDGWLYITIPGAKADVVALRKTKPVVPVNKILVNQFPTSLQLAMKVDGKVTAAEIVRGNETGGVIVLLRGSSQGPAPTPTEKKESKSTKGLDENRKKYELDVIVLDAGHGGKDPGTIGVRGTYEKNVALGIVLKLGKLIKNNLKDVKVVYTRDDDTFVELDRRGQIANEANGKLFVSVHCNSMPRKPYPKRGFEVYLLRPGRTDEAIAIAERENSVIELEEGYEQRYKKLTDENFILVTMAQTAHARASEELAEMTIKELSKRVVTTNNGVKQAGFLVLVGAAMPSIYVETAYLSNSDDEKILRSELGQQQYADAIFSAIKKYKDGYEKKILSEGNDLGEKSR